MGIGVIEREASQFAREASTLAIAFFRVCLYDLVLCQQDLDKEVLRRWERILRGGFVKDYSITRYFLALVEAKRRLRNPINVVAYLIYKMSHGGLPDRPGEDPDHAIGKSRCIACSAPIDEERRRRMLKRIEDGYRVRDLKTPLDCEEIVNTHLTQEEVFRFVGHEVSFSYQEQKIQEIYEELERQEAEAKAKAKARAEGG